MGWDGMGRDGMGRVTDLLYNHPDGRRVGVRVASAVRIGITPPVSAVPVALLVRARSKRDDLNGGDGSERLRSAAEGCRVRLARGGGIGYLRELLGALYDGGGVCETTEWHGHGHARVLQRHGGEETGGKGTSSNYEAGKRRLGKGRAV
jgi:hypothetical protein